MRVSLVNYGHWSALTEPEALLDRYHILTGWAEGLRDAGAEVTVVQGFGRDALLRRGGVHYRFVGGRFAPRLPRWRMPARMHRSIAAGESGQPPEAVHLNGLLYALQARHLRRRLPARCALVVQHHAEKPARGALAALQRWGLRAADGFFFTGREMARPWRDQGLIGPAQPVFEIMEGSSPFSCRDRGASRAETGMHGRPIFLWVANLLPGKDPLTVLDGFERVLAQRPEARLYMAYRATDMLEQVRERITESTALTDAVELLSGIAYEHMEKVFNSADVLLQGSVYEAAGIAVADALACGVVPVVTDIPSFRYMTGNGAVGALWPPGDPDALAAAILAVTRKPMEPQRAAARALFERSLSFSAIGRQALAAYRELAELRPAAAPGWPRAPDAAAPPDRTGRPGGR